MGWESAFVVLDVAAVVDEEGSAMVESVGRPLIFW